MPRGLFQGFAWIFMLALLCQVPGALAFDMPILSADFNSDTPNLLPDLTLPGLPVGDFLTVRESSGTIRVRNAVGTLTDQPVELNHVVGIGGLDLTGWVTGGDGCTGFEVSWRSLARSTDIFFLACTVRTVGGGILGAVEYRSGGRLTYNSVGGVGPQLPVLYTPDVDQLFEISIDMVARTTSLFVDGVPLVGFQDIPFAQAVMDPPGRLGFALGGTFAQDYAVDDIRVEALGCPVPLESRSWGAVKSLYGE